MEDGLLLVMAFGLKGFKSPSAAPAAGTCSEYFSDIDATVAELV